MSAGEHPGTGRASWRTRRCAVDPPALAARTLLAVLAILGCTAIPVAAARAATGASIRPSFAPDRRGASTAFTLAIRFSGREEGSLGEEGVPAPVSSIVVHLPAGLGVNLRGMKMCAAARLQQKGAAGCPSGSLAGRGNATLEVHAGSETIPEQATLWAFRGPNIGGRPAMEILGQGNTPLQEQTISTAVLQSDSPPYGYKLTVSIPPIPSLVYEPDASFISLSLTVGNPHSHTSAGAITVPHSCPSGGFPFAAAFAFADHSSANASASLPCP